MRVLALVATLASCSFFASTTPNGQTHSCMPTRVPAAFDAFFGSLLASLDVAIGYAAFHGSGTTGAFAATSFLWGTAVTAPVAAGAIYGFAKDHCPPHDYSQR